MNESRRKFLISGAALLGVLQSCGGSSESPGVFPQFESLPGAPSPVSLATYGGVPGAAPSVLVDAFAKASETLIAAGGGELMVPPGVYDFGSYESATDIVSFENLSNVTISARGAQFIVTTTENVTPILFSFINPNNVVIAGASFRDPGFNPSVDWRGIFCIQVEATVESSGFSMVDCRAESVVALFFSNQSLNSSLLRDVSIQGVLKDAYYGVGMNNIGGNAQVDLVCEDVRRGLISFGLENAEISIRMNSTVGFIGSNGFVSLICSGESRGNVENVRLNLEATGVGSHAALVHFYNQEDEAAGYMRNIDATVTVNNLARGSATPNVFLFDHQLPDGSILASTARGWDQIFLHGSVTNSTIGRIISNPSVSTVPGTIYVDANLAAEIDMSELAESFRIRLS